MFRGRLSLAQSSGHSLRSLEGRRPGDGPGAAPSEPAAVAVVGLLDAADAVSSLQTLEAKAHDGLSASRTLLPRLRS